jgi:hypothetical protein
MDFARVEAEFGRLKAQFESGALTEEEFKAQLEELMIEDEQGRWWIIGYETGQWYVHDGEKWVQQEPPRAAPGAPPTRPQHPGAADLTPDAQPRPTAAAPSRPALGLELRRDGVSVLLITAGWIVAHLGGYLSTSDLSFFILIGIPGGLFTGLVLRWTEPPGPWKQVPVVAIGWAIGMLVSWYFLEMFIGWDHIELTFDGAISGGTNASWMIGGGIAGLVGGLITALALKWTQPSIHWKHVASMTLGWGIGWAVSWAIGWSLNLDILVRCALWGGIGGAVGSWVMFWQLREARQNSP